MSKFRFQLGETVMCNLGSKGWHLGKIIALNYREAHWPADTLAPYQVLLEKDHHLIYVPEDDDRLCREPRSEELNIEQRSDALAPVPPSILNESRRLFTSSSTLSVEELSCCDHLSQAGEAYRSGRCHCCNPCPRNWSYVEMYSEHYRCAERNGLKVTHHVFNLGVVTIGDNITFSLPETVRTRVGYLQCPTLVRLPLGLAFSDDGHLWGEIEFDPHRPETFTVEFVAVSTADWTDNAIGLVRLEVKFLVQGNVPPNHFDLTAFLVAENTARVEAQRIQSHLDEIWQRWAAQTLSNRETCDQMLAELKRLRNLLERHPRLDEGKWWAQLGGFHMNVHKLLENTLFECELYLGYALSFGGVDVRRQAELNLEGCYQKRVLEAARFLWMDASQQMLDGRWHTAIETLQRAGEMKDGWGWAVNFGDIWISEAAAQIVCGVEHALREKGTHHETSPWTERVQELIGLASTRADDVQFFGHAGHPWLFEIREAFDTYQCIQDKGRHIGDWLEKFKCRAMFWCAQILAGVGPFPPKPKPRIDDAHTLIEQLNRISQQASHTGVSSMNAKVP